MKNRAYIQFISYCLIGCLNVVVSAGIFHVAYVSKLGSKATLLIGGAKTITTDGGVAYTLGYLSAVASSFG